MFVLLLCLLIIVMLALLSKIPVGFAMHQFNGYDNQHPRTQQAKLSGFGARALAAHKNSFEALIFFSSAVIAAVASQSITPLVKILAIVFVSARILYHFAYLMNFSTCRSLVWLISVVAAMSMFGVSLLATV